MGTESQRLIMDHNTVMMKLNRIAWQILEHHIDTKELVLAGITGRGFIVAAILKNEIEKISEIKINLHEIKIDKENCNEVSLIPAIENNKLSVIVVDDVLNSGKTLLYSLQPFVIKGFRQIEVAVLINRNHRRFPVAADYLGLSLATTLHEHVDVLYAEGKFEAYLK